MDVQSATLSGTACLQCGDTQLPKGRVLLFDEFLSIKQAAVFYLNRFCRGKLHYHLGYTFPFIKNCLSV